MGVFFLSELSMGKEWKMDEEIILDAMVREKKTFRRKLNALQTVNERESQYHQSGRSDPQQ